MTAEVKVEEKQVESSEVVIASVEEEAITRVKACVVEEKVEEKETKVVEEGDESKPKGVEKISSFKEESDFSSDLKDSEKKALSDLKTKLEEAIVENTLFKKKKESPVKVVEKKKEAEDEKKSEAVVTEEEAKAETSEPVVVAEGSPKETTKTDANVTQVAKAETIEAVIEKESPKEEVKTEAVDVDTKEEVKDENVEKEEEKKTEAVVTEEAKTETEEEDETVDNDIELWGVPLLPSKGAEGTDVILLKFLRARDFKVNEAFEMLKKTLKWRKEHKINSILGEDFGEDLASAAYMSGLDFESRPVCYNIYSVFGNEELYQRIFGSEQSRENLSRWRFQLMEKGIRSLF